MGSIVSLEVGLHLRNLVEFDLLSELDQHEPVERAVESVRKHAALLRRENWIVVDLLLFEVDGRPHFYLAFVDIPVRLSEAAVLLLRGIVHYGEFSRENRIGLQLEVGGLRDRIEVFGAARHGDPEQPAGASAN